MVAVAAEREKTVVEGGVEAGWQTLEIVVRSSLGLAAEEAGQTEALLQERVL